MQLRSVILTLAFTTGACGGGSSTADNSTAAAPAAAPGTATDTMTAPAAGATLSEDVVKAWINESVQGFVNGSSSEPQAITLDFQSVEIGGPQTTGNDQTVAGVRSDTYYPVTVRYTENDTYGSDVQHKQVDYRYWFYVDQSGNWNASKVGPA